MKTYTCFIFAKHDGFEKPFLFCIEPPTDIASGTRLLTETCRGLCAATAIGSSFMVDERGRKSIVQATGAYEPLRKVRGTMKRHTEVVEHEYVDLIEPAGLAF